MELSDTYMITGEDPKDEKSFLKRLENCLQRGISLIQLRAHPISDYEYLDLAAKSLQLCHQYQAKLILNRDLKIVMKLNADGVHLNSVRLLDCHERPLDQSKIVIASCHGLDELSHADKMGIDGVTLSPVLATRSHPDVEPLGWDKFREMVSGVRIPVFALGGVGIEDISRAKEFGGVGIAAISALWG